MSITAAATTDDGATTKQPTPQRVLLLGASGLTGGHCLQRLLDDTRVARVHVLSRRPLGISHAKLDEYLFRDTCPTQSSLFDVDKVICCLGTTLRKAGSREAFRAVDFTLCVKAGKHALKAGIDTFTVVSAANANRHSLSFYAKTKGQMEKALEELGFEHLIVARPSLLLGKRHHRRPLEAASQVLMRPLGPLLAKVIPAWAPLDAERLAAALVNVTLQENPAPLQILHYTQLIQLAR